MGVPSSWSRRLTFLLAVAVVPGVSGCTKVQLANKNKHAPASVEETKKDGPVLLSISPNLGPFNGSTAVTLTGKNFVSGATVRAQDVDCGAVRFVSDTQVQCTMPPHAIAQVSVTLTNPDGQSATLNNGYAFTSAVNMTAGFAVVSGGGVSAGTGILLKASIGEAVGGMLQAAPGVQHRSGLQGTLSN
jgi:hypothetical protein